MRALLSTIGSRGDVQPLVGLASELRAQGHDVRLCVPPDFCPWISGLGFAATPVGPEARTAAVAARPAGGPAAPPTREQIRQAVEGTVATQFDTIGKAAEGVDVIVAATALQIVARSVAEMAGIPYVFAAYSPNVLPSAHHAPPLLPPAPGQTAVPPDATNVERWARDTARFNSTFGEALNARRAALGLSAVDDVRAHMFTERPWLAADATLAPWPGSTQVEVFQPGAWIWRDDRPLSPELLAFLDAGEPPIYFGFGSARVAQGLAGIAIGAARALGRRALVLRGWADLTPDGIDRDCLVTDDVNVLQLFPRVAAVVHHGGAGTTTAAALGGAPQVVIPQLYDQHYWAARISQLGLGRAHTPGTPTVSSLVSSLDEALAPDVASRSRAYAPTIRRDGAARAVERLVALT
jgi:vancomycin aglycone glucosyltransferase